MLMLPLIYADTDADFYCRYVDARADDAIDAAFTLLCHYTHYAITPC